MDSFKSIPYACVLALALAGPVSALDRRAFLPYGGAYYGAYPPPAYGSVSSSTSSGLASPVSLSTTVTGTGSGSDVGAIDFSNSSGIFTPTATSTSSGSTVTIESTVTVVVSETSTVSGGTTGPSNGFNSTTAASTIGPLTAATSPLSSSPSIGSVTIPVYSNSTSTSLLTLTTVNRSGGGLFTSNSPTYTPVPYQSPTYTFPQSNLTGSLTGTPSGTAPISTGVSSSPGGEVGALNFTASSLPTYTPAPYHTPSYSFPRGNLSTAGPCTATGTAPTSPVFSSIESPVSLSNTITSAIPTTLPSQGFTFTYPASNQTSIAPSGTGTGVGPVGPVGPVSASSTPSVITPTPSGAPVPTLSSNGTGSQTTTGTVIVGPLSGSAEADTITETIPTFIRVIITETIPAFITVTITESSTPVAGVGPVGPVSLTDSVSPTLIAPAPFVPSSSPSPGTNTPFAYPSRSSYAYPPVPSYGAYGDGSSVRAKGKRALLKRMVGAED